MLIKGENFGPFFYPDFFGRKSLTGDVLIEF
jgi:hypothetical protein